MDLCRGPHIPNTSFVKAFACLKVRWFLWLCMNLQVFFLVQLVISDLNLHVNNQASSSYWRGKTDRESLQRVYGISFPDSKRLKVNWFLIHKPCWTYLLILHFRYQHKLFFHDPWVAADLAKKFYTHDITTVHRISTLKLYLWYCGFRCLLGMGLGIICTPCCMVIF